MPTSANKKPCGQTPQSEMEPRLAGGNSHSCSVRYSHDMRVKDSCFPEEGTYWVCGDFCRSVYPCKTRNMFHRLVTVQTEVRLRLLSFFWNKSWLEKPSSYLWEHVDERVWGEDASESTAAVTMLGHLGNGTPATKCWMSQREGLVFN